ncbi:MAG: putative Ig domain-containing protein, partial [Planctomycetota bacterium]
VAGPNQAPTITTAAVTTGQEGVPYSYDVDAPDPNGSDTLTFTLEVFPTGATIDSGTGIISWTPAAVHVGATNDFTVRVTDDGLPTNLFDEQMFVVSVAGPNLAPTITTTAVTSGQEGVAYSYDVDASDPNGSDTLTFSLEVFPTGATIDSGTGIISWIPAAVHVGATNNFTVRVTDDGLPTNLFDEQMFVVSVIEANVAPTITTTAVTSGQEGVAYSYDVDATDPNSSDTLTFSLEVFPTGATIDSGTGIISWTPAAVHVGATNDFTVRVTDNGTPTNLFDEQMFTVAVSGAVNNPPMFTSSPTLEASVGLPYLYTAVATDPDPTNTVSYTLVSGPTGATIDAVTGIVSWTPTNDQIADQSITLRATDDAPSPLSVDQTFSVVTGYRINTGEETNLCCNGEDLWSLDPGASGPGGVTASTDPITGTAAQMAIEEVFQSVHFWFNTGPGGAYAIPVANGEYFIRLSFLEGFATASGQRVFDVTLEDCPILTSFDIFDEVGQDAALQKTYLATISDGSLDLDFANIVDAAVISGIEVLAANHGTNTNPMITSTAILTANTGVPYSYDVDATDADGCQALTYALTTGPGSIDSATGVISWTPTIFDENTSVPFMVTVTDALGGSDDQSWNVFVSPPAGNTPPSFTSVPVTTATVNGFYFYQVTADDPDVSDTLSFQFLMNPFGASIGSSSGTITWNPAAGDIGDQVFEVEVSDGTDTATQMFTVETAYRINVGELATPFNDGTQVWSTDSGFDGATSTNFSVTNAIDGTTADPVYQRGRFPDPGATTTYTLPVLGSAAFYEVRFHFAEIFFTSPDQRVFDIELEGCTALDDYDIFTAALAASGSTGTDYAVVESRFVEVTDGTLNISLTNVSGDPGYICGIQVFSHDGANLLPVVTSTPFVTAFTGNPYSYTVDAFDPNACQTLTYAMTVSPALASFDVGTRTVSWTPGAGDLGDHPFTVEITDSNVPAGVTMHTWTVTVVDPVPPVIDLTPAPPATAPINEPYIYTVNATDPGDIITFSLDPSSPSGASINPISGEITWTPSGPEIGMQTITVIATDTTMATDTESFVVDVAYRINCGFTASVVTDNNVPALDWARDFAFSGSTGAFVPAGPPLIECGNGAGDDAIFSSVRVNTETVSALTYTLPLPAGSASYTVRLYYAEVDPTANIGDRFFDVILGGTTVETAFDIAAEAVTDCPASAPSGRFGLVVREYTATSMFGSLALTFANGVGSAEGIISAIEVVPAP